MSFFNDYSKKNDRKGRHLSRQIEQLLPQLAEESPDIRGFL